MTSLTRPSPALVLQATNVGVRKPGGNEAGVHWMVIISYAQVKQTDISILLNPLDGALVCLLAAVAVGFL